MEVWATGSIATCDYAGMIFGYGMFAMAGVVPISALLYWIFDMFFQAKIRKFVRRLFNSVRRFVPFSNQ